VSRPGYGPRYRRQRAELLRDGPMCAYDCGRLATTADHVPPLASVPDPELWEGVLVPSCWPCNASRGGRYGHERAARQPPAPTRAW